MTNEEIFSLLQEGANILWIEDILCTKSHTNNQQREKKLKSDGG